MSDYFLSFTTVVAQAALLTDQFLPIIEMLVHIENEENQ